uniref:RNase H type-1 domain-containing protein n=1 Tax=Vitis vinifera TaxID=29760 RepID=A5ADR8_VITVI|nr:hypothetical protein VITISV_010874 [Vitis vinifera]
MRPVDDIVTFPFVKASRVLQPHEDALVLTLGISGFDVRRVLIDPGSSTDLLQMSAYKQMDYLLSALENLGRLLSRFNGATMTSQGKFLGFMVTQRGIEVNPNKIKVVLETLAPTHLVESPGEQWWTLHVDETSKASDSKVSLILQSPTGKLLEQAIRLYFSTSNNEAEYEAVLARLDFAITLTTTRLEIRSDYQLIVGQIQKEYEEKDECMARYLAMVENCLKNLDEWIVRQGKQEHRLCVQAAIFTLINDHIYRRSFGGPYLRCLSDLKAKYVMAELHEVTNYFIKWVEAETYANIKDNDVSKVVWKNIVCQFGDSRAIVADNGS